MATCQVAGSTLSSDTGVPEGTGGRAAVEGS